MSDIVINVKGMSCGHCVSSVEGALKKVNGVQEVSVSLENNNVSVKYDESLTNIEQMKEVIEDQGYDVV